MNGRQELTATEKERPFSWSLRRRRLFERCRREYFLHYYGSTGGFETGIADPEREFLHHLKRTLPGSAWLTSVLTAELRGRFYSLDLLEPKSFRAAVLRRFERGFQAMLGGAAERSHDLPFLAELLQPNCSCLALHRSLKQELENRLEKWSAELIPVLGATPREQRRTIDSPLGVMVGDLLCYAVPLAAFAAGGILCIIESGEGSPEAALLHKMFAFNVWNRSPERVKSLAVMADERCREFAAALDVSGTLRAIRADVEKMTELRREDGSWHESDFPRNPERCADCRFRAWCKTPCRTV